MSEQHLPDPLPARVPAGAPAATTYASAGVDVEAGELAVTLMRDSVARAQRSEVVGGLGGFAGLFDASALKGFRRPLLATSTDGVGTKVAVAQRMGVHHTIGIDLVGMVVDDLVVCGAEPLFMTDYIAIGKVVPERVAAIVAGIAEGCRLAGCALVGGETAEHPGLLAPDEYDVAGAGTGVVEADRMLGPDRVRMGDVAVAMRSSGMHSNGYSLARHVLLTQAGLALDLYVSELGRTLGEELLEPTRIYSLDCLALIRRSRRRPARAQPHHGRRARGERRPGAAQRRASARWTARPGPRTRCSAWSGGWARWTSSSSSGRTTRAWACSPCSPRTPSTVPSTCWPSAGSRRGSAARCAPASPGERGDAEAKGGGGGAVSLVGTYAQP